METLKLDYSNSKNLKEFIHKNFFKNQNQGKVFSNPSPLIIKKDEEIFDDIVEGDRIVKLYNKDIDGNIKLSKVYENEKEVHLIPENRYCIKNNELYVFY